jgi:acetyl esterase/lipase
VAKTMAGTTVKYGSHSRQNYQWYTAGSGTKPAILLIHGGGWSAGRPVDMEWIVGHLKAAGFHCASIGYRFYTEAKWPAQVDDVIAGAAAVAARSDVDESRMGSLGASAGGLMALHLGLEGTVKACVCEHGVTNTTYSTGLGTFDKLFPTGYDRAQASPLLLATADFPPTMLHHGSRDTTVPFAQSILFRDRLRELGVLVEHIRNYGGHGLPSDSESNRLQITEFFREHV